MAAMSPLDIVIVLFAGLLLGSVNSIAGGGSLLFFPTLLAIGMPTLAANVTNAVVVLPGFIGAVYGFREDLRNQPRRRLVVLSLLTALGAATGSVLLLITPSSALDFSVPVLVLFASLLLAAQPWVRALVRTPVASVAHPVELDRKPAWQLSVAMFAAAIYGGYFGGALGVIMLAVLALTTTEDLRELNALKSALSLVVSTVNLPVFAVFGPVDWWIVAIGAPASLVGGVLGAKLARRLDDRVLRWCVVAVGVSAAVYLMVK